MKAKSFWTCLVPTGGRTSENSIGNERLEKLKFPVPGFEIQTVALISAYFSEEEQWLYRWAATEFNKAVGNGKQIKRNEIVFLAPVHAKYHSQPMIFFSTWLFQVTVDRARCAPRFSSSILNRFPIRTPVCTCTSHRFHVPPRFIPNIWRAGIKLNQKRDTRRCIRERRKMPDAIENQAKRDRKVLHYRLIEFSFMMIHSIVI